MRRLLVVIGVAVVAASLLLGAARAGATDPVLAKAALLRLSDLPDGWSQIPGASLIPKSSSASVKAACSVFDNAATRKVTALEDVGFQAQAGLPTVEHAVYLFPTARAAQVAAAGIKGPRLVRCLEAAFKEAVPAGISFTLGSTYRTRISVRGTRHWLYGFRARVVVFGLAGNVRMESITLRKGRALATLFFASDLYGNQVASESSLISLAAARLP